jgi:hypothetical protein
MRRLEKPASQPYPIRTSEMREYGGLARAERK